MFNKSQIIYFIGLGIEKYTAIADLDVPEEIENKYIYTKEYNTEDIKRADYIVAQIKNWEISSFLEIYKQNRKPNCKLVMCAKRNAITKILKIANISSTPFSVSLVDDIWPADLSVREFYYYYTKWCALCGMMDSLKEKEEILRALMNSSQDMMWVKDLNGIHKDFNNKFLEMLPVSRIDGHKKTYEECVNKPHNFLWELTDSEYEAGKYVCQESELDVINGNKAITLDEVLDVAGNERRNLVTTKAPLHDQYGNIVGTVGVAKDVTVELKQKEQLETMAFKDALTGIYNRAYITSFMHDNRKEPFSMFFLDIDNFKLVNDTYGHEEGNKALVLLADILKEYLVQYEIARYGGDEFIAIKIGPVDEDTMKEDVECLGNFIKQMFNEYERFEELDVSIGVGHKNAGDEDIRRCLVLADTNMYEIKKTKKAVKRNRLL